MSRGQLMKRFGIGSNTLSEWLSGLEAPEWTRRPNAKDGLRMRALELRRAGWSVPRIAGELGVAKSTAYLWVREIPLDPTPADAADRRKRRMEHMQETRWEPHRQARDAARAATGERMAAWVGELSEREVTLLGAVNYWCEGAKAKPWEPNRCRVTYINSDPGLVVLFLMFVESLGEDRQQLKYRISIHESAEVDAAGRWWAALVGVPVDRFARPTLKSHNPTTVRRNTGDPYRGCLTIDVPRSRELYWKIEGLMTGIVAASVEHGDGKM
jgi:transposase